MSEVRYDLPGLRQEVLIFQQFLRGVYCSPECADRAVKDLEALLDRMEREEESALEQNEE